MATVDLVAYLGANINANRLSMFAMAREITRKHQYRSNLVSFNFKLPNSWSDAETKNEVGLSSHFRLFSVCQSIRN